MKERFALMVERDKDALLEDLRKLIAIESVNGVKEKTEEALAKAREELWDVCNNEVDMQVLEIKRLAKEARNKRNR